MISVGMEVKLSKGKRAAKYVVVGFEKPLPMFEEGGGVITAILKRGRRVKRVFLEKVIYV